MTECAKHSLNHGGITSMNPKFKNNIGIMVPEILMPAKNVDLTKWACVACDQYTSQPDYWNKCEEIVGDAPSTLRLMLPEIYLEKPGETEKILAKVSFSRAAASAATPATDLLLHWISSAMTTPRVQRPLSAQPRARSLSASRPA